MRLPLVLGFTFSLPGKALSLLPERSRRAPRGIQREAQVGAAQPAGPISARAARGRGRERVREAETMHLALTSECGISNTSAILV